MEQTGGKWMSLIGAYMIVKGIVNLILGFSVGSGVDERDTYHPEYSGTSLVLSGRGYY